MPGLHKPKDLDDLNFLTLQIRVFRFGRHWNGTKGRIIKIIEICGGDHPMEEPPIHYNVYY